MRDPDDLLHRRHRAEHIRHMGEGNDLGLRAQRPLERIKRKVSIVVDIHPFQDGALALTEKMPGHDIGVVLHNRKDDLIASLMKASPNEAATRLMASVADS